VALIALGGEKAQAVAAAVEGPITTHVPASFLQLHPRVEIFVDEAAGAGLRSD
jgi:glucosamine-6-phosphate deaminase